MSLIAATQITAVATAVLALFAIVTAWYARRAFLKQSAEVTMLQQDRQREAGERRRAQAAQVFTCVGERPVHAGDPPQAAAFVRNTSRQPVYNISMGWGVTGQQRWPVLLPDGEHVIPGAGSSVGDGTVPIWIEFRDAAGVRWRATNRGELTDVPEPE
jgi:hypothetical protein